MTEIPEHILLSQWLWCSSASTLKTPQKVYKKLIKNIGG
jgi:hypothetical protein